MRRLLHRWFVEYNPIYLVSAALVLRGVNLISHGLLGAGRVYAELGGPALAELYAWALVGGVALLVRFGLRRPAVLLALIAVVYQGDLTLHTETCAYLGFVGWLASVAWLASFALKLVLLARALRLRPSPSAYAVPTFGAAGLVVVPRLVQHVSAHAASGIVAAFVFALFGAAISTSRRVESEHAQGAWGETVLRRATRATWTIWGALAMLHVAFWFSARRMDAFALVPVALLLATRFAHRSWQVWIAVAATLAFVGCVGPSFLSFASAIAVFAFLARARNDARAIAGALFCAHLAAWSAGWSGGPFPRHVLALDAALAAGVALVAWSRRAPSVLAPLALELGHLAVEARVVTAPVTALEWGAWSVGAGFFLLVATIGASLVLHLRELRAPP